MCESEESEGEETFLEIAEVEAIQATEEAETVLEADGEEVFYTTGFNI